MPSKREVIVAVTLRVVIATVCTVVGIIGVALLAKMLGLGKPLVITSSVLAGVCGFVFGVYWTMTYLVKSGYTEKK